MPNHFHLVLWPRRDGDLSRWMQWIPTTHVRRYHERRQTSGHVWQGPFKAFPIEQDEHLLTVLRYVERNPLRAGLCEAVDGWPVDGCPSNSLLQYGKAPSPPWLDPGPVPRGRDWRRHVARPPKKPPRRSRQELAELAAAHRTPAAPPTVESPTESQSVESPTVESPTVSFPQA